jgi:hypothetical protein
MRGSRHEGAMTAGSEIDAEAAMKYSMLVHRITRVCRATVLLWSLLQKSSDHWRAAGTAARVLSGGHVPNSQARSGASRKGGLIRLV